MTRILATIALRLAICTGISWAVWRWFGLPLPGRTGSWSRIGT